MSFLNNYFQAMADEIRSITEKTNLMTPEQMISEIDVVYDKGREDYILTGSLKFSSDEPFILSAPKRWDGTIEYTLDKGNTWSTWDGSELHGTAVQPIYLRGTGNTKISGDNSGRWSFTGKYCTGNIETLLDYQTVINGQHPTMGQKCYQSMFRDCTSLITVPSLPATTLAESCYSHMFYDCTSLITAPELSATTLAYNCYSSMFYGCTSLIIPPELPATTLAESCYSHMFYDCTSLITAPELSATTLTNYCYNSMFKDCTSLTISPELPATMLASNCYYYMFSGCTSLINAPELPATILASKCYYYMFKDCTSLKLSTIQNSTYKYAYRIPTSGTGTDATDALGNMFFNTGGTFTGTPTINTTYYTNHRSIVSIVGLKFSSDEPFTLSVANPSWNGTIEYTLDNGENWSTWNGNELNGTATQSVYLRGTGNTKLTGEISGFNRNWTFTGKYCTGNIETLLDYQTVLNGQHPTMKEFCYSEMFKNCTSLITAPELSATTLIDYCYMNMFQGCTSLTIAPSLPATTLAVQCYREMFQGCTSLTTAPQLSATTLAVQCYESMFYGCTSLATAPELSVTTLAERCYEYMFKDCTSLTIAPELPAITLTDSCYAGMFYGCTSLITAPKLPATTLAKSCYYNMFQGCTSLITAPRLPVTTLADYCYSGMFQGCTSLITAPELPATTSTVQCYDGMFEGCTSLTTAPKLPATTLTMMCYYRMFYGCASLTTLPQLPATKLASYCYKNMFQYCTALKLSTTQTGAYQYAYRIPTSGTGTTATDALKNMFFNTGGTFTDTPTINTTYYTDHQPV